MNKLKLLLALFCFSSLTLQCFAVEDEIANFLPKNVPSPEIHKNYNYESTKKIPVNLKVLEYIKSENELYEGQIVKFKVAKDVVYENQVIIKRGTLFDAKVSVIITPGMNGIPASIIFNNFEPDCNIKGQFSNGYEVFGQDRSLIVFPLKWALTILPPTGSLTNFIMGGHAKLKPKKKITIHYYPDWT